MMLSGSLVEIELRLGLEKGSKPFLGYTHVYSCILTFDFDSILWSFLTFWGPNGLLLGDLGGVRKLSWGLLM